MNEFTDSSEVLMFVPQRSGLVFLKRSKHLAVWPFPQSDFFYTYMSLKVCSWDASQKA